MNWTIEQQIEALLRLPWVIIVVQDEDGVFSAYADGIPSSLAVGTTEKELEAAFFESLAESLRVYIEQDIPVPLPPGVTVLPWKVERVGMPMLPAFTTGSTVPVFGVTPEFA